MANIQVNRGETKLGVFSEEEIKEGLRSGRFLPTDIGWREGMTTWQRLAEFPEFAAATAVPAAGAIVPATRLPWEHREELGFVPAFVETLKLVLLNPTVAFAVMKKEGGLGEPLLYGVIGGSRSSRSSSAGMARLRPTRWREWVWITQRASAAAA